MRHAGWFTVALIAFFMWALHGFYHVAEAEGWVAYTRTFQLLFGPSMSGWVGHIIGESLTGICIVAFAFWLSKEKGWYIDL